MSFAEFYMAYEGEYDDAWNEYMIYGGASSGDSIIYRTSKSRIFKEYVYECLYKRMWWSEINFRTLMK